MRAKRSRAGALGLELMGNGVAMRSGSETIASLASALAKAQAELVNPAKTLTGRNDRWGTGREGRTYRYAPLSAGLDIVRQTLCRHELAVLQTTHVEREGGLVVLTTTLAHGSGEWIAASWPVCRVGDLDHPQAMGAALTYARRYGLFTLMGIAGEDDLDAAGLSPAASPRGVTGAVAGREGRAWRPSEGGQGRVGHPPCPPNRGRTPTQDTQDTIGLFSTEGSRCPALEQDSATPARSTCSHAVNGVAPLVQSQIAECASSAPAPLAKAPESGAGVAPPRPRRRLTPARPRRGSPHRGRSTPPAPPPGLPGPAASAEALLSLARDVLQRRAGLDGAERAALEAEALERLRALEAAGDTLPPDETAPDTPSSLPPSGDQHGQQAPLRAL